MREARSYKICRNCRHVEAAEARAGGLVREVYLCRGRPGRLCRIVDGEEGCARFAARTLAEPGAGAADRGAKGRRDGRTYMIPLTRGMFTLVDEGDYRRLARHRWTTARARGTCYAVRDSGRVRMHRVIVRAPRGMVVDHINHNGLDNRRGNLRVCTRSENLANQRPSGRGSSRYKGVSWVRKERKWRAGIGVRGRILHLGLFRSEEAAARAYDAAARRHFGEFACLNFGGRRGDAGAAGTGMGTADRRRGWEA